MQSRTAWRTTSSGAPGQPAGPEESQHPVSTSSLPYFFLVPFRSFITCAGFQQVTPKLIQSSMKSSHRPQSCMSMGMPISTPNLASLAWKGMTSSRYISGEKKGLLAVAVSSVMPHTSGL